MTKRSTQKESLKTQYEDEDREAYEDLKRARYALLVDAEIAMCNGLSKEDWMRSPYVKSTRDRIWWLEEQNIHYIAEYTWQMKGEYFVEDNP